MLWLRHIEWVQMPEYELLIFDRWGKQMFETNDIAGFRDEEMDPAVFVWYIRMRVIGCDGEEREVFREGGVTIVK